MSISPYIPNTDQDRLTMLSTIGIDNIDKLFLDIPERFRDPYLNLPQPLSECELKHELYEISKVNSNLDDFACFLGAGSYRHFIPAVVDYILGRSEFYTAYTPYQAEVSQGTLQIIYEYQSLSCQLCGMEVSNAGMYDVSTAAAEGALMSCRITNRHRILLLSTINPRYSSVIKTYAKGRGFQVDTVETDSSVLSSDCSCLIIQSPDFFGNLLDIEKYVSEAHRNGALILVIVNPISLAMFMPPGYYGADIVVAEGQPLGSPVSFGGPGLGIFTCKKEYLRQIPGRIVSKTSDVDGQNGYVLALQTREQHIRRARATSNICSNQNLSALAMVVYLAALGKNGLRQVAELCYHKAHYAARSIDCLKGYSVNKEAFFNEFVVHCPKSPFLINQRLLEMGIIGGYDLSDHYIKDGLLFCVTELNTKNQIDTLVNTLKRI